SRTRTPWCRSRQRRSSCCRTSWSACCASCRTASSGSSSCGSGLPTGTRGPWKRSAGSSASPGSGSGRSSPRPWPSSATPAAPCCCASTSTSQPVVWGSAGGVGSAVDGGLAVGRVAELVFRGGLGRPVRPVRGAGLASEPRRELVDRQLLGRRDDLRHLRAGRLGEVGRLGHGRLRQLAGLRGDGAGCLLHLGILCELVAVLH